MGERGLSRLGVGEAGSQVRPRGGVRRNWEGSTRVGGQSLVACRANDQAAADGVYTMTFAAAVAARPLSVELEVGRRGHRVCGVARVASVATRLARGQTMVL